MKDYTQMLKRYLEQNPPNCRDGESVLGVLYRNYTEHVSPDNKKICNLFAELRKLVNLPPKEYDLIFYVASDLCLEHGRLAFAEGLRVGIELILELSYSKEVAGS